MSAHSSWTDPAASAVMLCLAIIGVYCATKAWSDVRLGKRWITALGAICAGMALFALIFILFTPIGGNDCCC
ncbi:MAG TPA: hypothetical protein VGF71_00635 [Caulobacteraceae bacterium]|jgi:hypothetical protein